MSSDRITATYRIETPLPIARAAEVLAGEQSSGTFVAVPGETDQLRARFGARVEKISELEPALAASLPGSRAKSISGSASASASGAASASASTSASAARAFNRAELTVSWPAENVGHNLPALVSTLQGNLYELAEFSGIKLLDFDVPASFAAHFRGPRFGVAGTRTLTGVAGRPLIGTIIKPSVGMSPAQTAGLVGALVAADIDFIKDDELMADPPHSPFEERVDAVMSVINRHADRTGRKVMYAFNISGEIDEMLRHYDKVRSSGGTAAMVSLNSVGLAGVKKVCDHGGAIGGASAGTNGALAIHGHRNGWGMLNRHPMLGIEFAAYQKYWRLAGVDQIHVNGITNKFCENDDSVVRSIEACQKPLHGGYSILPVVSSGQTGLQAPETYRRTRTIDLLYLAGGGIIAHPGGPAAGVKALRQAWEAAVAGIELHEYSRTHTELRQQLEKFGGRA